MRTKANQRCKCYIAQFYTKPTTERCAKGAPHLAIYPVNQSGNKHLSPSLVCLCPHLELCLLHPPARLVEPDPGSRNQRLLQRAPNLNRLHRPGEFHRQSRIVQTRRRKLIRLIHKRLLEPAIIVRGDLPPYASGLVDADEIRQWLHIHRQLALGADDFSRVFLPRRHHPRTIQIRDPASIKFHNAHRVIAVVMLPEVRLHRRYPRTNHTLHHAVLAEKPERQIDIMDRTVHEYTAAELGVGDEEAAGVEHVAGLGAENGGPSDEPGIHFRPRVAVAVVEAAGEAAHDFEVGPLAGGVDDGLGLFTATCNQPGFQYVSEERGGSHIQRTISTLVLSGFSHRV